MSRGSDGPRMLRRPSRKGYMGPLAILSVQKAMTELQSADAAAKLLAEAKVGTLPDFDEPVREARVAALHHTVRAKLGSAAQEVLTRAGILAADAVMDRRMSLRAQTLLMSSPWPVSAWLLGRSTAQNAWTFAGSGRFEVVNRLTFRVHDNPLIRKEHSDHALCDYHRAFFTRFFSALVHDQLTCTEVCCAAAGDPYCEFRFHRREPTEPPKVSAA